MWTSRSEPNPVRIEVVDRVVLSTCTGMISPCRKLDARIIKCAMHVLVHAAKRGYLSRSSWGEDGSCSDLELPLSYIRGVISLQYYHTGTHPPPGRCRANPMGIPTECLRRCCERQTFLLDALDLLWSSTPHLTTPCRLLRPTKPSLGWWWCTCLECISMACAGKGFNIIAWLHRRNRPWTPS